ncbi:hypothetical protein D0962_09530 [Leptolyngbyaceae cyanobacterium CCMR0082]|uniref:Uncharacterized protein n=1 Tax=Adonisia turfae CCMR0082 TaxID=2304604 RepID=A0A6M0S3C8_9CYAN|nr:hypothetical protein [Adonisia turfae CCMR0082]
MTQQDKAQTKDQQKKSVEVQIDITTKELTDDEYSRLMNGIETIISTFDGVQSVDVGIGYEL